MSLEVERRVGEFGVAQASGERSKHEVSMDGCLRKPSDLNQ